MLKGGLLDKTIITPTQARVVAGADLGNLDKRHLINVSLEPNITLG